LSTNPGSPRDRSADLSTDQLLRLLEWMAEQDFERIREALLPLVEQIVVERYATVFHDRSRPNAYRWIKYEDPDPIGRLHWSIRRLDEVSRRVQRQSPNEEASLAAALEVARGLGYSSS
jgi:hypothetical protein